jgi:hypothetical protein
MHRILCFFTIFLLIGDGALFTILWYAKASRREFLLVGIGLPGRSGQQEKAVQDGCGASVPGLSRAAVALLAGRGLLGVFASRTPFMGVCGIPAVNVAVGGLSRLPGVAGGRPAGGFRAGENHGGAFRSYFGGLTKELPVRDPDRPGVEN